MDLTDVENPGRAALFVYRDLCILAEQKDQDPGYEVGFRRPGERELEDGEWQVVWEAGPFSWGIRVSSGQSHREDIKGQFMKWEGNPGGWFPEPYHSFDLIFSE